MKNKIKIIIGLLAVIIIGAIFINRPKTDNTVTIYGWGGDQRVNEWIDNELAPYASENYGIEVVRVPMNIDEILMKLTNEKNYNNNGSIDVIWINGENFYYAKQYDLLYGPFLYKTENAQKYVDLEGPEATVDFGYSTEGYEAPWGKAQFVFVHDKELLPEPPKNSEELKELVKNNPGIFTYPEATDFVGSAFIRTVIYDIIGYENIKDLPADYEIIKEAVMPAMNYLNEIKPYLWKEGKTYPKDSAQLDGLYQDKDVYIAMDYNANKALSKVKDKSWSESTKTFVWEKGTPFNTHYLAIAANSPHVENSMKLIEAALSPEMQISKANLSGWGDLPVLEYDSLSVNEQKSLDEALTPHDQYKNSILSYDELSKHKQPELRADLVTIIEKVWEDVVLFGKQ
ncbi:MAG: transporter substrate-binding protein [Clostridiaceae bacterium]|jgi:putative spermidine/putrescine transport system substrate-binding protein|nr:transporter substrate-binding protein [Clostridiaceae bacterium]